MKATVKRLALDFFGDDVDRSLRRETEEIVARSILFDPDAAIEFIEREVARGMIPCPEPSDFESPALASLLDALLSLSEERAPLTPVSIVERAGPEHRQYLASLFSDRLPPVIGAGSLTRWLSALRAARNERETRQAIALSDPETIRETMARIEARDRTNRRPDNKPETAIARVAEQIARPGPATGRRLPFRLPTSDALGNQMRDGDFAILAARPGVGKSTWALRWAADTSMATGRPVIYCSFEMSTDACWRIVLYSEAKVSRNPHQLTEEEIRKIDEARDHLKKHCRLVVHDGLDPRVSTLVSFLEREAEDAAVVVIDYLGLLVGKGEREYDQLTDISRTLRGFSQRTGIPILAIHQFNRSSVGERRPPDLHDLRGSGQLEQDATHVMFLDHVWLRMNEKRREEEPWRRDEVTWILRKVREGASCTELLKLRGEIARLDPSIYIEEEKA